MSCFDFKTFEYRDGEQRHTIRTSQLPEETTFAALCDIAKPFGIPLKTLVKDLGPSLATKKSFQGASGIWGIDLIGLMVILRSVEAERNPQFASWLNETVMPYLKGDDDRDEASESDGQPESPRGSGMQVFNFKGHDVRTANGPDGQPWWFADDVCDVLGITNSRNATSRLDDDEKSSVRLADGTPGNPNRTIISESGLYSLILRSDKAEAKSFRKWITSEVLPSLRKTSRYEMGGGSNGGGAMDGLAAALTALAQGQALLLHSFNETRQEMVGFRQAQAQMAEQIDQLNRITLTPLRYVPKGYHLLRVWSHDHGIELDSTQRMKEGARITEICELHGIEPLGYQRKEGHMVVHLYPTEMCKLWENDYRRRNPNISMMILFPK